MFCLLVFQMLPIMTVVFGLSSCNGAKQPIKRMTISNPCSFVVLIQMNMTNLLLTVFISALFHISVQ